jgi:heme/copper-type cytochrome/quinol oxidase subunit 3
MKENIPYYKGYLIYADYETYLQSEKPKLVKTYMYSRRQRHRWHIVSPSPWPILTAISVSLVLWGFLFMMHFIAGGVKLFLLGLVLLILVLFGGWFRDIVRESSYMGYHTISVQKNLRLGFILFIVSEVMFFSSFFWAYFHCSLSPSIHIGAVWPPEGIIYFFFNDEIFLNFFNKSNFLYNNLFKKITLTKNILLQNDFFTLNDYMYNNRLVIDFMYSTVLYTKLYYYSIGNNLILLTLLEPLFHKFETTIFLLKVQYLNSIYFNDLINDVFFLYSFFREIKKWIFVKLSYATLLETENLWAFIYLSFFNTFSYKLNFIELNDWLITSKVYLIIYSSGILMNPYNIPLLNTVILLVSGATLTLSHTLLRIERFLASVSFLLITIFLALYFIFCQCYEYCYSGFAINDGIYGSTFFMLTGFHGFHVFVGTCFLIFCLVRFFLLHYTRTDHLSFECAIWYWHFVDVIWIILYLVVYLWPSMYFFRFYTETLHNFHEFQFDVNLKYLDFIIKFKKSLFNYYNLHPAVSFIINKDVNKDFFYLKNYNLIKMDKEIFINCMEMIFFYFELKIKYFAVKKFISGTSLPGVFILMLFKSLYKIWLLVILYFSVALLWYFLLLESYLDNYTIKLINKLNLFLIDKGGRDVIDAWNEFREYKKDIDIYNNERNE